MKDRYPPIDDVATATSWWARFGRLASNRRAEELALAAAGELDERADGAVSSARRKSDAMSRAPVAAGRNTRSAAEGEPVNVRLRPRRSRRQPRVKPHFG